MEAIKLTQSCPQLTQNVHEDLSETCSGPSCSVDGDETHSRASCSVDGDDDYSKESCHREADDAISLCSWTTDLGDDFDLPQDVTVSNAANDFGHSSDQFWPCVQTCSSVPWMPQVWPEHLMPPIYQLCYVVVPQDVHTNGTKKSRKSKKGQNSEWFAEGTWFEPAAQAPVLSSSDEKKACNAGKSRESEEITDPSQQTTVILRNFPSKYTRTDLLRLLDDEGFSAAYDFIHLPIDFQKKAGLGYAVVNMISHQMALSIWEHFAGFDRWDVPCDTVCEVAWNRPHQGLEAHIERYRNSPLMHESVPDVYRPALFDHGLRVEFAAPTSRIRAPRIRHQKNEGAPRYEQ